MIVNDGWSLTMSAGAAAEIGLYLGKLLEAKEPPPDHAAVASNLPSEHPVA